MRIFIFALCAICLSSCTGGLSPHIVQEELLNEAVYASGEILPDPYMFLQSPSHGVINSICVKDGSSVQQGDILLSLGSSENIRQIDIVTQQLEIARKSLNDDSPILSDLAQKTALAKEKYNADTKNAERYATLLKSQAVSSKEAEHYILLAESSRVEYERLKKSHASRLNELTSNLLDAERQLSQAVQAREDKVLRSKIAGKVFSIWRKEGETVNPGENIMLIGDENKFRLNLMIDERDMDKVKIGHKVHFETDGYPGRIFTGTIYYIDPVIQPELRSFKAEASIDDDCLFFPQSTIEANIIIREKAKSLLIPLEFLMAGDSVWRKSAEGKIISQKVVTGIKTVGSVEISEGLNSGDVIYKKKR